MRKAQRIELAMMASESDLANCNTAGTPISTSMYINIGRESLSICRDKYAYIQIYITT